MSFIIKHCRSTCFLSSYNVQVWRLYSTSADVASNRRDEDEEEFRVLDILKKRERAQRKMLKRSDVQPNRADRMSTDQNWGNVWPGPKTFHPSSVPLPLRQGYVPKGQAPPGKMANAELMKVPNFLHLTPPVIKAQCEAIKQFCTEWPTLLNSEEAIEQNYPIELISSDYCHASPSIRNPMARVTTLRIKLSSLKLNKRAKDKFLRLVGERYNEETDLVTFTADRCPVKKQNFDYVNYLLTACYHEAWTVEDWETEKCEEDMEYYDWDKNASKKSLVRWHLRVQKKEDDLDDKKIVEYDISQIENGENYKNAVSALINDGESDVTVREYGAAVRKLFGLPQSKTA